MERGTHRATKDDPLVSVATVLKRYGRFAALLDKDGDGEPAWRALQTSDTSGKPLGSDAWLNMIEAETMRTVKPQKRGPKAYEGINGFIKQSP